MGGVEEKPARDSYATSVPSRRSARTKVGRESRGVSAVPSRPSRRADTVAGFLCAFSLALSGIALARNPALLATAAIIVGLVAARMTETHRTFAALTIVAATLAFIFGMVIAIVTNNGLV
jgi:hypothetical protein